MSIHFLCMYMGWPIGWRGSLPLPLCALRAFYAMQDSQYDLNLSLVIKPIERLYRQFISLLRRFLIPLPCFRIGLFNATTTIIHKP